MARLTQDQKKIQELEERLKDYESNLMPRMLDFENRLKSYEFKLDSFAIESVELVESTESTKPTEFDENEQKQVQQTQEELAVYHSDGTSQMHAHPAVRLKYLSSFTGQEMLSHCAKMWASVHPLIEKDIKENKAYPYYDLKHAIERECFSSFVYITTDSSDTKKPDEFFQGIKGLVFHKSLLPFKKQFGEQVSFQVFPCIGDINQEKYKNICKELKIERQSVPKTKLQSLREKCIRSFGNGDKLSIAQIKSNWKADTEAIKTWLELSEETRSIQEAPWLWWCMNPESQAMILRVHIVNTQLGIKCTREKRYWRDNSGPDWTRCEVVVRRNSV